MKRKFLPISIQILICLILSAAISLSPVYASEKININTASEETLQTLPGIGPALAKRIIEQRKIAPFQKPEDITMVSGIGPATFEKLKEMITVKNKKTD